jgi:NAD(P)-dependent dehydrogenase (short-subunit alcohol dehydrogenase family)
VKEPAVTVLDRFRLDDKVVVVTGASSGLGVAFAQAFAEAGADVVLGARRVDRLPETGALVEAAGRRYAYEQTDVTDPSSARGWWPRASRPSAGSTCWSTTPGSAGPSRRPARRPRSSCASSTSTSTAPTGWRRRSAGPAKDGGSIINISSVLGIHPGVLPQAAYAASKAGLIGLTRDLAQQWTGRKGIRVNAIAPGYFPTEMTDEMDDSEAEMVKMITPAGRLGDPAELASVGVFLASEAASYVTGITLPVDGGMTMP